MNWLCVYLVSSSPPVLGGPGKNYNNGLLESFFDAKEAVAKSIAFQESFALLVLLSSFFERGEKTTPSMPNMIGRPGHGTMEMFGGSSAPYLVCTPCVALFCTSFNRGGNRGAFRLPGAGGGSFPLCSGTFARSYSVSKNGPFY